jgi:hypothetical protein
MATFCPTSNLLVQFHQNFDKSAVGCKESAPAVGNKNVGVPSRTANRADDDPVIFENIHRAFHEPGDHSVVQNARSTDLGRERRYPGINKAFARRVG